MHRSTIAQIALALALTSCSSARAKGVVELDAQSFGRYSQGQLRASSFLADSGPGWTKIFRGRNRRFGNDDLISVIRDSISRYRTDLSKGSTATVEVGDLANQEGGKASPHISHQNGLDVDIGYVRVNRKPRDPDAAHWYESFVHAGTVSSNFDASESLKLIEAFASDERVKLVYVDQAIEPLILSSALGEPARSQLRAKLAAWPTHDTHFHVRLRCPKKDTECEELGSGG